MVRFDHAEPICRSGDHDVAAIELEGDASAFAAAFGLHFDCAKCSRFDLDLQLLDGRDENVNSIRFAAKDGREQPDHRRPRNRGALVVPGAVPSDPHLAVPAVRGVPSLYRWKPPLIRQLLQFGEA